MKKDKTAPKIRRRKKKFWREKKTYDQPDPVRLVNINIFKRNTKL